MSDDILAQFSTITGDDIRRPTMTHTTERVMLTNQPVMVAVPFANNAPVGEVKNLRLYVKFQQLRLADRRDMLFSQFELHNSDDAGNESIKQYAAAIANLGEHAPALYVIPIDETVTVGQQQKLPMYLVVHDPYIFEAYQFAQRAEVPIIIPEASSIDSIMLMALSERQHQHQPSYLELCDTVARLIDSQHLEQSFIAIHLVTDPETGRVPSQTTISNMAQIARLPESVRQMVHTGQLTRSHANLLIRVIDVQVCEQLAQLVVQGSETKTVSWLKDTIAHMYPEKGPGKKIIAGDNGMLQLESPYPPKSERTQPTQIIPLYAPWATRTADVHRYRATFAVRVIANNDPKKVAVSGETFTPMLQWMQQRSVTNTTSIAEIEGMMIAFLTAIHEEAQSNGMLNSQGKLAPVIEQQAK